MNIKEALKNCCGTTLEPCEKQDIVDYVHGLEAQVEAARSLYVRLTNNAAATDSGGVCYVADNNLMTEFDAWNDATPQQHLREVRAEAGLAGFVVGFELCLTTMPPPYNALIAVNYKGFAEKYAASIRNGKDDE